MPIFPLRRTSLATRRRPARRVEHRLVGLEALENRLALAIDVNIVDNTNLGTAGSIFVTGHGIPGNAIVPPDLPSGTPPAELRVLDPTGLAVSGKFIQAAVTIDAAQTTGTTAKITTTVPHQLTVGDKVFVSGVLVPGYNGVFTVTKAHAGTRTAIEAYPGRDPGYFEYSVSSPLLHSTGGAAYLPSLMTTPTIATVSANAGIVTVTLAEEANIPLNSPIFLQGLSTPVLAVAAPSTQQLTNVGISQVGSSAVITLTASGPHGLVPGQNITISNSTTEYNGSHTVLNTGLFTADLTKSQFQISLASAPTVAVASGTVKPTNSGVIATNTSQLVVNIASGTAPSSGQVTLTGVSPNVFNGTWTAGPIPPNAGLPSTAALLTAGGQRPFTEGGTGNGGQLSFVSVDLNGVQKVTQNSSTNPALGTRQFQYALVDANGTATLTNASIEIVSLNPIALARLPKNAIGQKPNIILDNNIADFSAQFVQMVTPAGKRPFPLGISPGTANLSNLGTPPFAVGAQTGTSVADIVEFYYAGSVGGSTFDLSGVDGFALPLTLNASSVSSGVSQVGINTAHGVSRELVGTAFTQFIQKEPTSVKSEAQFGRLLYTGPTSVNPLTVAVPSALGTALTGVAVQVVATHSIVAKATTTAAHGLVPGQKITVTGAGSPYDGTFTVTATGLTETSLTANEFTYTMSGTSTSSAIATVTPTNSGVIAASASLLAVQLVLGTGQQAPAAGSGVQLANVPNGTFLTTDNLNANYTVVATQSNAGLPANTVVLSTTTDQTFVTGSSTGSGTLQTPVFVPPPVLPGNQFYVIAAPKDWLVQQPPAAAILDPMVTWWDTTINNFFKEGNYLQVAVGFPLASRSYAGTYNNLTEAFDFRLGTATSGALAFSIAKPTPSNITPAIPIGSQYNSLANALWVWAQANIPKGDYGLVWDQIVQAFCRGVALDGVLIQAPTELGKSNAAWTTTSNWYKERTAPAGNSVYCPYSKFLHFGTLSGGTDRSGATSIYTGGLAYGFSEDEIPIGQDGKQLANPLGGPSKMDGTVPDGATITLTVNPWIGGTPQSPSVSSIDTIPQQNPPGTPMPTHATTLSWTVSFSERVKGVTLDDFVSSIASGPLALTLTGVTANSGSALSQTWTVTGDVTGTGTDVIGVNLTKAGSITDASGTPLTLSAIYPGQTYRVTTNPVAPTATITIPGSTSSDAATVPFTVTFSQAVIGLTLANFTTVAGGVTGSSVQSVEVVSGSGNKTYTVTVNTGSGSGKLALKLDSSAGLAPPPTGLPVTSAAYTINKNDPTKAPEVQGIALAGSSPTSAATVAWTVTFTEPVTGVSAANFALINGGLGGTPTITSVTPASTPNTATWTVTASTGSGTGTLGLNMATSTNVRDADLQAVTNVPFTGDVYSVDRTAPAAQSIVRANASPTSLSVVSWTVIFGKAISGLSQENFQLAATGLKGAKVTNVAPAFGSAPSAIWTVTAATGSGSGSLRLDLFNATGITDAVNLQPTGIPLTGQSYTVSRGGATNVDVPIAFMTTMGKAAPLRWLMNPFTDADSTQLTATLSATPGTAGGTFRAASRRGVTVTPSGTAAAELTFTGTAANLNAYFKNAAGLIRYTPAGSSLMARTLTLSAQGSDGLSGFATAALLVRAAARLSPPPAVNAAASLAGAADQPLVITYAQLVTATGATQTASRSVQFMLGGLSSGRLEVWNGGRWIAIPARTNIPLLAPGGQIRWTPPVGAAGVRPAFSVKAWDGWRMSGASQVRINLAR